MVIVVSRYNASVTDRLREGAVAEYSARFEGGAVTVVEAPGSYELPALALAAARTGRFEGIVAIGCLIRGETSHDQHIASAVAHGLVDVTIATGVPVAFGVLTTNTAAQARARAGGAKGNKGQEAMAAVLDAIEQVRVLNGLASGGGRARPAPDKAASAGARGKGQVR